MYKVIEYNEYIDNIGQLEVRIGQEDDDIQLSIEGQSHPLSNEEWAEFAKTIATFNRKVKQK